MRTLEEIYCERNLYLRFRSVLLKGFGRGYNPNSSSMSPRSDLSLHEFVGMWWGETQRRSTVCLLKRPLLKQDLLEGLDAR